MQVTNIENNGIWCDDNKDNATSTFRKSVSNCIHGNMKLTMKETCQCDSLTNCAKTSQDWDCARQLYRNPYDKYSKPDQCKESCSDVSYEIKALDLVKTNNEPQLCLSWFNGLQEKCASEGLSGIWIGLCNEVQTIDCSQADTINYDNKEALKLYVQSNLIGLNVFAEEYYMQVIYFFWTTKLTDLINGILLNLVVFFGFSLLSIPEILYYTFCSRGGGCVCKAVVQNCQ